MRNETKNEAIKIKQSKINLHSNQFLNQKEFTSLLIHQQFIFTKTQETCTKPPFLYFMCDGMQNYQSSESGDQQITSSSSCHGQ